MSGELICGPHFRRTGKRVPAYREVNGEGLCKACFAGKPICGREERDNFPWFLEENTRPGHKSHA